MKDEVTTMTYRFSTMATENFNEEDFNKFYDFNGTLWISKESFTVELNSKDVELHLFIEYTDLSEFMEDTLTQEISIGVLPSFKSLSENHKRGILGQFTGEHGSQLTDRELLSEVFDYGLKLALHTETTQNMNEVDHLIKSAIAVSPCVSGLIGFDLDRMFNRIGNTGWDFLSEYCEGADLLQLALERYNKERV